MILLRALVLKVCRKAYKLNGVKNNKAGATCISHFQFWKFHQLVLLVQFLTIFESYSSILEDLIKASISENSKFINKAFNVFFKYREDKSLQPLLPRAIDHVINFIAYMYERDCAFSTVKCYLSGFSFFIKCLSI